MTAHPSGALQDASLQLVEVTAFTLRYPLTQTVSTSFGTMRDRPAVLVRLRDAQGIEGWGEAWCNFPAPAADYRTRLIEQVLAPLCVAQGQRFSDPRELHRFLSERTRVLALQCAEPGPFAQSIAALEMAAWDLVARRAGLPLWKLLGGRGAVPVYASGIHPREAQDRIVAARAQGHVRFKVKVGFSLAQDAACLERACGDHEAQAWMVDANQAWDEAQSLQACQRLAGLPLQWLEEPMAVDAPADAWERVARAGIALAGGENLRGLANFESAGRWLRVLQPDVAKWGGVGGCLDVAAIARSQGRWFCPHWLGSGVGLAFSLAILDAHLAYDAPHSPGWAEVDVNPNPLRDELMVWCQGISDGTARLNDTPGIGPAPAWDPKLQVFP